MNTPTVLLQSRDRTLTAYLHRKLPKVSFYSQADGWSLLERTNLSDILRQRAELEENPNNEVIVGISDQSSKELITYCEEYFLANGLRLKFFTTCYHPTILVKKHTEPLKHCTCTTIVAGDYFTTTKCSAVTMNRTDLFIIVSKTSEVPE